MKSFIKTFVVAILFLVVTEASAQISVGPGLVYGTDINNIGISVNGKYEFNEKWSAAPAFIYFLKKDYVNWSALDLDANYQLTEIENLGGLYAIGGLNMTFFKIKYEADFGEFGNFSESLTGSDAGINLGIGLNIATSEKFALAPEVKYTLGGANYLRIGIKVMFGI